MLLQVGAAAPALAADLSVASSPAAVVAGQPATSKTISAVSAPSGVCGEPICSTSALYLLCISARLNLSGAVNAPVEAPNDVPVVHYQLLRYIPKLMQLLLAQYLRAEAFVHCCCCTHACMHTRAGLCSGRQYTPQHYMILHWHVP
jgi:hypothetical protein